MSEYNAMFKWADGRKVWYIAGPEPFGGLESGSEEQVKAVVDLLNEVPGKPERFTYKVLGKLEQASHLYLVTRDRYRPGTISAGANPAHEIAKAESAFHEALLAELQGIHCAIHEVAREASLGPVETRRIGPVDLEDWLPQSASADRERLHAAVNSRPNVFTPSTSETLAHELRRINPSSALAGSFSPVIELDGNPSPSETGGLVLGKLIPRDAALAWVGRSEAERLRLRREEPDHYPDASQTLTIMVAVMKQAARSLTRVRITFSSEIHLTGVVFLGVEAEYPFELGTSMDTTPISGAALATAAIEVLP